MMNKEYYKNIFTYVACLGIILFSFFHHSSLFSPFLNSDDAVVVLMIHNFRLPQDLYYWHANRFGSFVPLIGQFFFKVFHLSPIQSEAFSHYLLLISGYFGFASLFRSNGTRLIFALIWFLPPLRMIDILKGSSGEEYALIGIGAFFINKLDETFSDRFRFKKHIFLILATISFIAAVWVSDLGIITVGIIVLFVTLYYIFKNRTAKFTAILVKSELYYIILGTIIGALFIGYAKVNAVRENNFYNIFNPEIAVKSFKMFAASILDLLSFRVKEPFTSLSLYLLLSGLIITLLNYQKIRFTEKSLKWTLIFLFDLILLFIVLISSQWVSINGVARRYFVGNYISFWLTFLFIIDSIYKVSLKKFLVLFITVTVLLGGLGTLYNFKYISPKSLRPTIDIAGEFKSLGRIGIISEYWNSYINSAPDPDRIKATPNDKSFVRNQSLVDSVFNQPNLYIIRDMWMDSFPDTLQQFGYMLKKDGNEFRIAHSQVCRYKKIKLNKYFDYTSMKYDTANLIKGNEQHKKVLYFSPDCNSCKNKFVVYGPYCPVGIGTFKAQFYLKMESSDISDSTILCSLDVAADWGQTELITKTISKSDFKSTGKYEYIDLEFNTTRRYPNIELRIFYYGNASLYFDHVKLVEI